MDTLGSRLVCPVIGGILGASALQVFTAAVTGCCCRRFCVSLGDSLRLHSMVMPKHLTSRSSERLPVVRSKLFMAKPFDVRSTLAPGRRR